MAGLYLWRNAWFNVGRPGGKSLEQCALSSGAGVCERDKPHKQGLAIPSAPLTRSHALELGRSSVPSLIPLRPALP